MKTKKDNFNKIAAIIVTVIFTPIIILLLKDLFIMVQKCYKMTYNKLKTIEKLNDYKQMYLKAQDYKTILLFRFQKLKMQVVFLIL